MSRRVRAPVILISIAVAAIGPIWYSGLRNCAAAQSAQASGNNAEAARLYELAARQLFWRADLWEQAGISASRARDTHGTIRLLEAARPRGLSIAGWDALGSAYWADGQPSEAVLAWKAGSQAHSTSTVVLLDHLAAAYHQQADYRAEEASLLARLALVEEAGPHYRLGLILMLTDPQRAQSEFRTAALNPEYTSASQTLLAALDSAALESKPSRQFIILGRGLGLVEEWRLALRAFEQATTADGQDGEAWAWLAEARAQVGQDESWELDIALRLGPHDAIVHALRGLHWRRQGNDQAALAEYQQAAEIEPENAALQLSLGETSAATGDLVAALAAYQKATALAPQDATVWRLLAIFCDDNGVQALQIGLPAALRAVALAPGDPQTLEVLGWSYAQSGYLYSAEHTLLHAIQLAPDYALAHLHLAGTYLRKGDRTLARQELTIARGLDANGPVGKMATQLIGQYFP